MYLNELNLGIFRQSIIDYSSKLNKVSSFSLMSGMFLFISLYILALRHLEIHTKLGKTISLFQNWYPKDIPFTDARILSDSIWCFRKYDLFKVNPCFNFYWNYPTTFKYMPLWMSNPIIFEIITIFAYTFIIFSIIKISKMRANPVFLLVVFSPSFLFGVERGNFEGVILILISIASYYFALIVKDRALKKNQIVYFYRMGLVVVTTIAAVSIKFYPIVMFLFFAILSPKKYQKIFFLCNFLIMLLLSYKILDLAKFISNVPSPHTSSLGLNSFFYSIFKADFFLVVLFITVSIFSFNKFKLLFVRFYESGQKIENNIQTTCGLPPFLLLMAVWLIGGNTLYRAILILPALGLMTFSDRIVKTTMFSTLWFSAFPIFENFLMLLLLTLGIGYTSRHFKDRASVISRAL